MALYTVELRFIIASGIELFDFDYPKIEGKDYDKLEKQFINHFYFREIGSPTADKFKFWLEEMWMARIDHYNKLWKQNNIDIDVLSTGKQKQIINDTPMSELDDEGYASNIVTNEGYSGTEIELLETFNKNLRDLDFQFIQEFEALFMQVH